MSDSLYQRLVTAALDYVQSDIILDCIMGSNCLGIHTEYGTGLAYTTDAAWGEAEARGVPELERDICARPLSEVIKGYAGAEPLAVNLGLAAINAMLIHKGEEDPLDWFQGLKGKKRLGMVGYFCPIMDRLALTGIKPVIFELRDMPGTHRPEEAPTLMPACDAVLITGSSFANKTVHHYLPHISPDADAFIFGHSTPLADFLLESFTLGSSLVTDKVAAFAAIRAGQGIRDIKAHISKVIRRKTP